MEVVIYTLEYTKTDSIDRFIDFYHSLNMKYLASDLLDKGLSPKQISEAVTLAIKVVNSSGIEVHKHFMPVFSGLEQGIIEDCKLTHLGYGLVLMNADSNLAFVSEFQIDVLKGYLNLDF